MALRVCQQALAVVFDPYQDLKVKFFYLDDICLPILLRCSSTSLQAMLCGADGFNALSNGTGESCFIKQLMDLITKHMSLIPSLSSGTCILDSDAISATLLQICCCFSIIETIYDRFSPYSSLCILMFLLVGDFELKLFRILFCPGVPWKI